MILTKQDCLWYASLYAFASFGVGYWIRKLVSIVEARLVGESLKTSERRTQK